jgi:hypothetical protein
MRTNPARGGAIAALSIVLAACVGAQWGPYGDNLSNARQVCNRQYPRRIGSYLPHAACVNDAVERFAIGEARYPDLVRLQEDVRVSLSDKIDARAITVRTAEHRMRRADALVAQASRDRDAGNETGANRHIAAIDRILRE